jgi:hypothetical protein
MRFSGDAPSSAPIVSTAFSAIAHVGSPPLRIDIGARRACGAGPRTYRLVHSEEGIQGGRCMMPCGTSPVRTKR